MKTECGGRAHRCNGPFEHLANGLMFLLSRHYTEDRMSGEKRRDGHRDRMGGNIIEGGETFVIDLLLTAPLIERDDLHGEWVVEIGGWIVEGKVSIHANPAADDVDGRGVEFGGIFGRGPVGVVLRLDQVDCAKRQAVKDGSAEPGSKALRRSGIKAQVFIHVEGFYARPVYVRCLAEREQHLGLTRRSSKQDANAILTGKKSTDFRRDVSRGTRA